MSVLAGIDTSDDGWHFLRIDYPPIRDHDGVRDLLYDGNGFGKPRIGHGMYEAR
jgi:hypothetical protein